MRLMAMAFLLGACAGGGGAAPAVADQAVEPVADEPDPEPVEPESGPDPEPADPEPAGPDPEPAEPEPAPSAEPTPEPAPRTSCPGERWGGWEGTAECRRAARRSVRGVHRRCETDADCVMVGTACDPHAVSRGASARYERWLGPCGGPGAGACAGPGPAVCDRGCCERSMGGLGIR